MKKIFFAAILGLALSLPAEDIVPAGTYGNLISNGELELYAGTFPAYWRFLGSNTPGYAANGGCRNRGRFFFLEKKKNYLIRQDWTFTIIPGEKYRLSAMVKCRDFRASLAYITVFNNAWRQEIRMPLPAGTYDWKKVDQIITGFPSRGGYYSIAIRVHQVRSGQLEISDISLEPATQQAFEKSTAYRKLVPPPELVVLSPRKSQIPATSPVLHCRWFGSADVKSIAYSIGKLERQAAVGDRGLTDLDLSGLPPGKHTVQVKSGSKPLTIPIMIRPGLETGAEKRLNNFHYVIAEKTLREGETAEFGNPRAGWVLFGMPDQMELSLPFCGRTVRNGDFLQLDLGKFAFTVKKGNGPVRISAVAETAVYPLGTGPFLRGMPKHDWKFTKKYELPVIMSFLPGTWTPPESEMAEYRKGLQRFYSPLNIQKITQNRENRPIQSPGLLAENRMYDGIYIDEVAMSAEKPLVMFLKNLPALKIPAGRDVLTYICGNPRDTGYTAELLSQCANLSKCSKVLSEIYIPNQFLSRKDAEEAINARLIQYAVNLNKVYPGINPFWGVALCHSNTALRFTLDHEPEADHRVLLDMQMHAVAVRPEFRKIGHIGFWGDNYSDQERTRWIMKLFRHYVFEGKTSLLSEQYGMKLHPGHLRNASFRQGTKYWKTSGKIEPGTMSDGGAFLKRFNNQ
ncbi:MAG: hypothetical protein IJH79_07110, partial [Lentisphaeria bacterium]|nr:hypothetical protein [Lentisphaeria bacterium]